MTTLPRRATREDVPAMASVVAQWEAQTAWMDSVFTADELAGFIGDAFDDREMWVCGNPVVAYASFDPHTGKLGALYSLLTGQGIGKALMDQIKQDRDFIWLRTHVPNVAAQRFYVREGFVEVSRHGAQPPHTVDEIQMAWHR